MLRSLFLLFILPFFVIQALSGQRVLQDSIKWELDTDGNLITLRYKLTGVKKSRPYLGVFVKAKGEAGTIPITLASGDIGRGVDGDPAREKVITFDPVRNNLEDLGNLRFKIEVVSFPAEYAQAGKTHLAPVRQLPGLASAVLGAGAGIASIFVYRDSKALYDVYKSDLNPYSQVYAEKSREDHYLSANKKYRNAQILAGGGGALFLGGAALWIQYRLRKAGWNKMQSWTLAPSPMGATLSISLQKR